MTELNGPSGINLMPRGPDAFLARLTLVDLAERSLDLQYYIWHDDTVGKLLLGAVLRAADRGVRVRLLIDDVGAAPDDRTLLLLDAHPNIEVRLFNPISTRSAKALWMISDFSRVNRRMHNKSFTADNQMTIVGGRNIGDEYFEASTVMNYADLDALAIGAAVAAVSARFDRYWNSPIVYGISELRHDSPASGDLERAAAGLRAFEQQQRDGALRPGDAREPALAGAARRPRLVQPRAHRGHGGRSHQGGAAGERPFPEPDAAAQAAVRRRARVGDARVAVLRAPQGRRRVPAVAACARGPGEGAHQRPRVD